MDLQEFTCYQEMTFDSYCKRLVKNECRNALREIIRREKNEVVFSALSNKITSYLFKEDTYNLEGTVFHILQNTVTVNDGMLAKAIMRLPDCWRSIILMFYFMCQTDKQIGGILGLTVDAIYYRRRSSIRRMRKLMEGYDYGL